MEFLSKTWQTISDRFYGLNVRKTADDDPYSESDDEDISDHQLNATSWESCDSCPLALSMIGVRDEKYVPGQVLQVDGIDHTISDQEAQRMRKGLCIGARVNMRNKRQSKRNSAASTPQMEKA